MAVTTYNPYSFYGDMFGKGMDSVIQNLPSGTITMDDLLSAVFNFMAEVIPEFYTSSGGGGSGSGSGSGSVPNVAPLYALLYGPLVPNAVNDYTNMKITNNVAASPGQRAIITSTLNGIKISSYDSLANFFAGVDQQIANCSNLNNIDKALLYAASALANASNSYWQNILATGGGPPPPPTPSPWSPYLDTSNWPANYYNLNKWIASAYLGALSGFSNIQAASMNNAGIVKDLSTVAAQIGLLMGSIGLNSAKLIFQLPQGPVPCC